MSLDDKPRISVVIDQVDLPLKAIVARADAAAKSGAAGIWASQLPSHRDVAMLLAGVCAQVPDVTIGTAVLPIYMCPPVVMAQMAITLDEISEHRLMLGLGCGHRIFGEWMLGTTYSASVPSVREYLEIVTGLIREGEISTTGSWFSGRILYGAPRRAGLPVVMGSVGPRMLELAAELADGVILWMCTPGYVRDLVMPRLRAGWARRQEGHANFSVIVMLPAAVSDHDPGRECGRSMLNGYIRMENYKRLLTSSGFGADVKSLRVGDAMVDELCAIGSPSLLQERIAAYREAGATEIALAPLIERHFVDTVEAGAAA
jgi:alkanesulfonate monooxygenase SsuD/methylene tetrahydromethanopterin reductase-like flavin-dependent oxidoreductase (luciferase family)